MEMDADVPQLYRRTPQDVQQIVHHAKLDEKQLTHISQALYYPTDDIAAHNLKLLELDEHLLQQLRTGQTLCFKGGLNEKVVLCSDDKTYDVKAAEISNSLLLVSDLKFAQATSLSPLRAPRTGGTWLDRSHDDSLELEADDAQLPRKLEHRQVQKIFHEYLECREIRPRFRKLGDLLQLTRYSGAENEEHIDSKLLFSYEQLLDTIQCSRKQFAEGLRKYRAFEYEGHVRMLEYEYEYRIINVMVSLIAENSWQLDEIERDETIAALDGIAPTAIVQALFDVYTEPTPDKPGKFRYKEELVARIVAQNILAPGLKFRVEEFFSAWQEAMPEGMRCKDEYLRALGIFDKDGNTLCIRSLIEENLSQNISERMKLLFKTKAKWTLEEMEPYIECFTTPTQTVSQLLAKHARSLTEQGKRYYVSKH